VHGRVRGGVGEGVRIWGRGIVVIAELVGRLLLEMDQVAEALCGRILGITMLVLMLCFLKREDETLMMMKKLEFDGCGNLGRDRICFAGRAFHLDWLALR
jgi:hypothetical protein